MNSAKVIVIVLPMVLAFNALVLLYTTLYKYIYDSTSTKRTLTSVNFIFKCMLIP